MSFSLRFATLLLALTVTVLMPRLTARVMAQTIGPQPILQAEENLQAGFYNVHEFSGQANQTVTMLLESEAFDAYLILEDAQGNRIATHNDISSANTNAALIVVIPTAGRYRVIANAGKSNAQGPYRLTIQPTHADQPNPLLSAAEVMLLEADQHLQAGIEQFNHSDFRAALALWEESLVFFREEMVRIRFSQESRQGEANSLNNLGIAYHSLGEYSLAIDFHQQSLDIAREIDDHQREANALGNLGLAYYTLGKYGRAIDFLQQSLDIDRAIGNRKSEANALGNLGIAYDALGNYARAIDFHQQSLDIKRAIGDRQGEAASLGNLGNAYHILDEYARAIDFHQQQLDIVREIGNRQGEVNALGNLGNAYNSLGDYSRAIDFHQQALDIAQAIGDRYGEAKLLGNLGNAYGSLDEYDRAIDFHQQQLDIVREIGDRQGESISLHNLGLVFRNLDNLTAAKQHFQASAQVHELLHDQIADSNSLSLFDSRQITYSFWQVTLMELGQPKAALTVAERGRAQALAISMARSLDRETEAFEPPIPLNLEKIQAIAVQQNSTLVEYSVFPSGLILIWIIQPDGTIHSTESNTAALDESLVETADIFATLGKNSRGAESTETPLETLIQDTQAALTRGGPSDSQDPTTRQQLDTHLQELHKVLIAPIAQWLPKDDQQRVIFIPHRELFRVPFAALQDSDGNYLIEKHTILTAPSIQSLELASQHRDRIQIANPTDALVVGNPTFPRKLEEAYGWQALPGAEREAHKVGDYLTQRLNKSLDILFHNQATETLVKERLHDARFIHLATHGTLVSSNEQSDLPGLQYSSIPGVLALAASDHDDGSLTADELLEMTIDNPLNAELVVLSACQTGQGPITSDGVYGLSRTLLTAGVPTLVVSLWNASDTHTVELMDKFYHQFLVEDQDKAQALRQAMLHMIKESDDNPQNWAAFTLVGVAE